MDTPVRLIISYDGRPFAGWQRQDNALTVQECVERSLSDLLGTSVTIHGAGRTDAGVHARGQVAHSSLHRPFPLKGLVHGGNHRLPSEIRLLGAHRMPVGFHARKSALGKEYRYRIFQGREISPLDAPYCLRVPHELNLSAVRQALVYLPGRHDFTAFALAGGSHGQPFRNLQKANLVVDGRYLELRFEGDGFLRGMVRCLVGTLVEIGLGQHAPSRMEWLLQGRPRREAGPTAAAHGLVLQEVFYGPQWQPLESYDT